MTVCIIQARMGSTRLPNKVLEKIGRKEKTVLEHVVGRCLKMHVDNIVVATSTLEQDTPIVELCDAKNIDVYRGDELDVLKRYYNCALSYKADKIVRITSDCPFLDPDLSNIVIDSIGNYDYASNGTIVHESDMYDRLFKIVSREYDGFDTEIFSMDALDKAYLNAQGDEREHVTTWMKKHLKCLNIPGSYSTTSQDAMRSHLLKYRLTLDTAEDLDFLRAIYKTILFKGE